MRLTKLLQAFLIISFGFLVYSCNWDIPFSKPKPDPDPDPDHAFFISLKSDPTEAVEEITLSESKKSAFLLIVESSENWTASTETDWINLAAWSGSEGKMGLIVGVDENLWLPRTGSIIFKSGEKSHEINVTQAPAPKIDFLVGEVRFSMIYVEGGLFSLGSSDIYTAEHSHLVKLDSYYIGETEVTNALWLELMKSLPCEIHGDFTEEQIQREYENLVLPVSATTWDDINEEFLPKLNQIHNLKFRLPTEAEWEYAAMGGINKDGFMYSGSNDPLEVAWHYYNSSDKQEIAGLKPNSLSIYDMSGNVSEWCYDWYVRPYKTNPESGVSPDGYSFTATINPKGPDSGEEKVIRGGSFKGGFKMYPNTFPMNIKERNKMHPSGYAPLLANPDELGFRAHNVGFRFVLPL